MSMTNNGRLKLEAYRTMLRIRFFEEQVARLEHARDHADLYIQTDELNPQQVLNIVLDSL